MSRPLNYKLRAPIARFMFYLINLFKPKYYYFKVTPAKFMSSYKIKVKRENVKWELTAAEYLGLKYEKISKNEYAKT